jgi:hypothetical protein
MYLTEISNGLVFRLYVLYDVGVEAEATFAELVGLGRW